MQKFQEHNSPSTSRGSPGMLPGASPVESILASTSLKVQQYKEADSVDNLGVKSWLENKGKDGVKSVVATPREGQRSPALPRTTKFTLDGYSDDTDSDEDIEINSGISLTRNIGSKTPNTTSHSSAKAINISQQPAATAASHNVSKRKTGKKPALPAIPYINEERANTIANDLNAMWTSVAADRIAKLADLLQSSFKEAVNPYSLGLYLSSQSFDFFLNKSNSLAFNVMQELKKWLSLRGMDELERQFLSPPLQIVAFQVVTAQKNASLLKFVIHFYRLDLIRDQLVSRIRELAESGNFKDACTCATVLRLYQSFSIHDFLIPLILQERYNSCEEFMVGSEEVQRSVLKYLDGLLAKDNIRVFLVSYVAERNIQNVNKARLEPKPMTKLIQKLCKKFKIDPAFCPNSSRKMRAGTLKFILSKKYGDSTVMNDGDFEDTLDDLVLDDPKLQDEAIFLLRVYGDIPAAAKFAIRKRMSPKKIPDDVLKEIKRLNPEALPKIQEDSVLMEEENWDDIQPQSPKSPGQLSPNVTRKSVKLDKFSVIREDRTEILPNMSSGLVNSGEQSPGSPGGLKRSRASQNYYTLHLPYSHIRVVDSIRGVNLFLKQLKLGQTNMEKSMKRELFTVGFDSEWKPINPGLEGVAIVQVATRDEVFIIDCLRLKDEGAPEATWKPLFKDFFANERIFKLGYGVQEDRKKLAATSSHWKHMPTQFKNVLDLQILSKELQKLNPKFFQCPSNNQSEFKGLAELVRLCTGTPLNKDEQWSNWEKRPLRDTQLTYAAADAFCLLELFDFMRIRSKELHLDFNKLVQNLVKGSQEPSEGKHNKKRSSVDIVKNVTNIARSASTHSPFKSVRPAESVRIVVDSMFAGLGKQLRACGVDTVILEQKETHTKCALHALKDDRYIVTQGSLFDQLSSYVPSGHCYKLTSDSLMAQLRDVLVYFNVAVNETNIFTRCQRCNCDTFIHLKSEDMRNLLSRYMPRAFGKSETGVLHTPSPHIRDDMIPANASQEKKAPRAWSLLPPTDLRHVDGKTIKTKSGAMVDLRKVPSSLLGSIDDFYICNECGRCYWEGIQLERVLAASKSLPPTVQEPELMDYS